METRRFKVLLAIAMAVVFTARIGAQSSSLIDTSKITDAKARAAMIKINELQAGIKELKVDEMTDCQILSPKDQRPTQTLITKITILQRRPDLMYKLEKTTKGPLTAMINAVVVDGKNIWQMGITGQGAIDRVAQDMRKRRRPQVEIDQTIAKMRTPRVSRLDIARLKEAGVYERALAESCLWLNVLAFVDPASLTVDAETPATMTISGKIVDMRDIPIIMTFNKADGMCVKVEPQEDGQKHTITIDKYTINPSTPIDGKMFFYQPSAKVSVTDATDGEIRMRQQINKTGK